MDDAQNSAQGGDRDELVEVAVQHCIFDQLAGQQTNWKKTLCWATTKEGRDWLASALPHIPQTTTTKQLGAQIIATVTGHNVAADALIESAKTDLQRLRSIPRPRHQLLHFIDGKVCGKIAYAAPYRTFTRGERRGFRTEVITTVFGTKRQMRAPELVTTLICKGHLLDKCRSTKPL